MKRYWLAFVAIAVLSFGVLLWQGFEIYHNVPPTPKEVVSTAGKVLITRDDIQNGQNVWQSIGGMEVGSIWGHGSYVAPDWTADWLHRELSFILDHWALTQGTRSFTQLSEDDQAVFLSRLKKMIRTNTYDTSKQRIVIDPVRAQAFESNAQYYANVFSLGRSQFAIPQGALTDPVKLRQLSAFFFWTSWAASTDRPGKDYSYTTNWPHEDLIGNRPTGGLIVWTGASVILLLAGISGMVWYYGSQYGKDYIRIAVPNQDPLGGLILSPSQRSLIFYFFTVAVLFLLQIGSGILTAHYGVEGAGFYGIPIAKWIPYSITRTWHVQLGLFWIATAWLAAGLFVAPVIGGKEDRFQKIGVIALLAALYAVVLGSLTGEWLSIFQKFSGNHWFYWGHQGYEYIDLGRIWQIALFAGLLLWLFLVVRMVLPAFKKKETPKPLLGVLAVSLVAIALLYGAGLAWGQKTPLPVVEYWRWWVVHLWVEGFFEVFATAVIAFLFAKMSLIDPVHAARATLFASTVYLSGGIIGTLHHLYFSGTPISAMALGSVFSALEVVPLVLVGLEAWEHIRRAEAAPWVVRYQWPIYFFVAVAFWNMIGAGLFGFMINPPIALYYMQGLNTTPLHGHAALFGVYGMLGLGLILFCLRFYQPRAEWSNPLLGTSFWCMNGGLMAMCVGSLLPVGMMQTWVSVEKGYWYARSSEFMQIPVLQFFRWLRVPGDTLFAIGALFFIYFILTALVAEFRKAEV